MIRTVSLVLVVILGGLGLASVFTVSETEYAIRFQLGNLDRSDIFTDLRFKVPFVNNIRKFDNRLLSTRYLAGAQSVTSEQKFVECGAPSVKWQRVGVARFYTATQGDERFSAINRLDGIVSERIRNQIATRALGEVISEQRVSTMQDIVALSNIAAEEFTVSRWWMCASRALNCPMTCASRGVPAYGGRPAKRSQHLPL